MVNCGNTMHVLLIEDSRADAFLVTDILESLDLCIRVTRARDGAQAIDILLKDDGRSQQPIPDLVILDLNLPRVHGFEVLSRMKASDYLRKTPVVVVTGSLNKDDEVRARSMGVIDYLLKPSGGEEYDTFSHWFKRELTKMSARRERSDEKGRENVLVGGSLGRWPSPPSMYSGTELIPQLCYSDASWMNRYQG